MEEWVKETYILKLSNKIDFNFIGTMLLENKLFKYEIAANKRGYGKVDERHIYPVGRVPEI